VSLVSSACRRSFFLSSSALAGAAMFAASPAAAAEDFTTPGVVTIFEPREYSADFYIPSANNPMGCSASGWFRLKTDAANYQSIFSLVLTQYASHATVRLYTYACDTDGATLVRAAWAP
jgi:hypothetical protein